MHDLMSVWRTMETWGKVGVFVALILMLYLLLTAVRSPQPPQAKRSRRDQEAGNWADGFRTVDSYTKDRR